MGFYFFIHVSRNFFSAAEVFTRGCYLLFFLFSLASFSPWQRWFFLWFFCCSLIKCITVGQISPSCFLTCEFRALQYVTWCKGVWGSWDEKKSVFQEELREAEPRSDGIRFANTRLRFEMKRDLPAYRTRPVEILTKNAYFIGHFSIYINLIVKLHLK